MNILTQVCGLIIIILLLFFYQSQKKLSTKTERMYLAMLYITLAIHLLDLASVHVKFLGEVVPFQVVDGVTKAYLFMVVVILVAAILYIGEDVYSSRKEYKRNIIFQVVLIDIASIGIVLSPLELREIKGISYAYGPAVFVTYGIALYCIILILAMTVYYKSRMNADRRIAVLLWMGTWSAMALVQMFFTNILLVTFAVSVGMVILYVRLENPGMNIDRQSGIFNTNALASFLKHQMARHENNALILFQMDSIGNSIYGKGFNWTKVEKTLDAKNAKLFRKTEDSGVLIFNDEKAAKEWEEDFFERIQTDECEDYFYLRRALWVSIYESNLFVDVDELLYYMRFVTGTHMISSDYMESHHIIACQKSIEKMRQEKEAETLIDEAIDENRVEVFYQPIFSVDAKRFSSAEALVRIRDKEGNIVPPAVFIPAAEKNGKIITLGNIIFEKVCHFISEKNIEELGVDYIEVNLSPVQCSDERLANNYISLIKQYNVNPKQINLEITESATFRRKETVLRNIAKLMDHEISFSLDDFGTGHSNLNYIVDMPVNIVKFDRGMMEAFFVDDKANYVLKSATQMIHGLGLKIVSEGIETKEQFDAIRDMGISYIQGFYFSKPLPEDEFCEFVKQKNLCNEMKK